jgi:hypothetical protein
MPPAALPDLLEAAEAGDVAALARLYAMAAACAREGRVMPPELGQFIAGSLQEVSRALLAESGPALPRSLARALKAQRAGKRGRKPSRSGADYGRLLAASVAQRVAAGMSETAACAWVAEHPGPTCNSRHHMQKDVEHAWRQHRADLLPNLPTK